MLRLIARILINMAALYAAAALLPGIAAEGGVLNLLVVALIFGVVNALVRPIVKALSCPLMMITLGLFTFVINAGMLLLTSWLANQLGFGFSVDNFIAALMGSVIISVVSLVLNIFLPDKK
jgi:putative membrane protein